MIKDIKLNEKGKPERCFILKDGTSALVVIPFRKLLPVDYQRLMRIQAKGGEMLRVMRDDTLDNGRNALKQYEPLFEVIQKEAPKKEVLVEEEEAKDATPEKEEKEPAKRGPGRPRGSRNKKRDADSN